MKYLAVVIVSLTIMCSAVAQVAYTPDTENVTGFNLKNIPKAIPLDRKHIIVADTVAKRSRGIRAYKQNQQVLFVFSKEDTMCMWNRGVPHTVTVVFFDSMWNETSRADMKPNSTRPTCSAAPGRFALEYFTKGK